MYYKDLTPYTYCLPFSLENVLNVGWLDKGIAFELGKAPPVLKECLYALLNGESRFAARVNPTRGRHSCNLCSCSGFDSPFIGSCEIWIPAINDGIVFAAPSLIVHYIEAHDYLPPEAFIRAVLAVDLSRRFNAQDLYDGLMEQHCSGLA